MQVLKKTLHVISSPKSSNKSNHREERGSCDKKVQINDKKPLKVLQKYYINLNYASNPMKSEDFSKRLNSLTAKNMILKRSIDKNKIFDFNTTTTGTTKLRVLPRREIVSQKNLDANNNSDLNIINKQRNGTGKNSKQILENSMRTQNTKQSFFCVCSPSNGQQANTSKLRIVSRDKYTKKAVNPKLFKINLQDRKNSVSDKKSAEKNGSVRNPKAIELYLKLEKLVNAKSRSIDMYKAEVSKGTRGKNNVASEDKDQTKYMMSKKPFNHLPSRKETGNDDRDSNDITRTRKNNKYYQYLADKLKNHSDVKQVAEIIQSRFKNWRKNDKAEIYDFKSDIEFYKIKQKIGKGCFGQVYLATQLLTNTSVALKAIPKINIKNKDSRKKIEKEVEILKRINNNSHIIKLFEVFEDNNNVYLVFEYLENGDLVKYFKANPLFDEPEQKVLFKKIVKGVEYLHKNQIIHRDIKLDNILLDRRMNPKLCDFGISSVQEPNKKIYDTGGTPAYLAPEVVKAEGEVGLKSDVWSLGVLLYLLTFGIVPFKANDMQVLYNKIIIGKYKFPEYEFATPELIELIKAMLVVDVKDRISIDDIINHQWFENSDMSFLDLNDRQNSKIKEQLKKEGVVMYLEDLGFPYEFIQQTLQKNLFNHVKACIDSLIEKFTVN